MESNRQKHHFLVVTYPAQGHINPALNLAKRLAQTAAAAGHSRVTFSTAVSAHRKMFPHLSSPHQEHDDGLIAYVPFSDGYDEGFKRGVDDATAFLTSFKRTGSRNLSSVIDELGSRGQPVTCVIYTFLISWAADVAHKHRIPCVQYWIQPATVFAIYYHFFHGHHDALIAEQSDDDPSSTVKFPGLRPLRLRDLPSFLTTTTTASEDSLYSTILSDVKEAFLRLDRVETETKPKVLVNTFDELEADALAAVESLELIAVGPILQSFPGDAKKSGAGLDLFKPDEKSYMEWLDSKAERSVVYISFGSISVVKKKQMEEILKGLKASGRPYLWAVRKDSREEGFELEDVNGMVVEWCSQVNVLSHPSVGCFVTHCGWNSTLESLVCGVPTVGVPQWTDQATNAMLMEKVWGIGVRGEVNGEGVLEGDELKRGLDLVMGDGERGVEIRRKVELWKEKAKDAVSEGGSSVRNMKAFVNEIIDSNF